MDLSKELSPVLRILGGEQEAIKAVWLVGGMPDEGDLCPGCDVGVDRAYNSAIMRFRPKDMEDTPEVDTFCRVKCDGPRFLGRCGMRLEQTDQSGNPL